MHLILASTSPRRREILALLGVSFEVIPPGFDEVVARHRPIEKEVLDFAVAKAASVAKAHPHSVVIGSDTMISIDGEKFGKPAGIDDAKRMLRAFSGRRHRIFTSVALVDGEGGPGLQAVEEVSVVMRALADEQIESYLACGESLDKAGAYSIQGRGRRLIDSIEGDYLAAVGMPLRPIGRYLRERGVDCLDVEKIYTEKSFLNWRDFHAPNGS